MANDYTNMLLDSLTIALYNKFGSNYTYYKEGSEQNTTRPYFVVSPQAPIFIARSFVKYDEYLPIVVYYFGDDTDPNLKSSQFFIAEALHEALEYVELDSGDGLVRGYDMSWDTADGVLQFYVTYRLRLYKNIGTNTPMEELFQTTTTKG